MTRSIRSWRVITLLALLSLILTWPLLPHILTHVPGDGIDDPGLAWNLWWAKDSWVDRAGMDGFMHNPFDADVMFYPISINLAFYTLTLLNGALSIPLQSAVSLILTSNLLLLSSFVIGGFGMYLLTLELLAHSRIQHPAGSDPTTADLRPLAAILAALLYAFASAKLFYVSLGQFNIASSQWLPFIALYLVRGLRQPWRWQNGFLMGLFLLLQTWAELTFGTFGVLLIAIVTIGAVIYAVLVGIKDRRAKHKDQQASSAAKHGDESPTTNDTQHILRNTFSLLLNPAIAAGMFIIGLLPYLLNMLPDMLTEGDFLVEGGGFSDIFSVDILGLLFPTQLHPLLGSIARTVAYNSTLRPDQSQFMINKGQHLFFGFSAMLLAAYGLWVYRRKLWVWAIALLTAFFVWVSLGPVLRFNGYETGISGIFPLLLKIPFFQANRYPSRYSVLILLGVAILMGLGVIALLQHVRPSRRKWVTITLAAILLFEHLSIPLPLSDFRLPATYDAVVADDRPGAILDLPIGWRNGFNVFGKQDTIIMFTQWYQTYHGKPRLGGNTSRNPEQKFQYFMEHPVIGVLAAIQDQRDVPPDDWKLAQQLAPDLLRTLNIHTVVLHRDTLPDFEAKLLELFPLDKIEEQEDVARYEARWPDERKNFVVAADDPEMKTYLDRGWGAISQVENHPAVWATREQPKLLLPGFTHPAELTLILMSPGVQTLTFRLDNKEITRQALRPGLNTLTIDLPASADGYPRHLDIESNQTFAPTTFQYAPRALGNPGMDSPVDVVVRSAGKDVGDFAHIYVDGVDLSPNQRGYNLVALDPDTGDLLAAEAFDTHDPFTAPESSAALVAWIDALPAGTIVAGAVRDAAALSLGEDAWQALQTLGVHNDIRGNVRRAHSFVGVKGAPSGSAMDFISDLWPVTVTVGDGITEPNPSFALLELGWNLKEIQ